MSSDSSDTESMHLILLTLPQVFQAVDSAQCRKIIFSTNIAETSLTVDGIGFVVDTGVVRVAESLNYWITLVPETVDDDHGPRERPEPAFIQRQRTRAIGVDTALAVRPAVVEFWGGVARVNNTSNDGIGVVVVTRCCKTSTPRACNIKRSEFKWIRNCESPATGRVVHWTLSHVRRRSLFLRHNWICDQVPHISWGNWRWRDNLRDKRTTIGPTRKGNVDTLQVGWGNVNNISHLTRRDARASTIMSRVTDCISGVSDYQC
jgi:hypothetical protein